MSNDLLIIAPVLDGYRHSPIIVHSMLHQSSLDWRLILVTEGRIDRKLQRAIKQVGDERISYIHTSREHDDYGGAMRCLALRWIREANISGKGIVQSSADTYYVQGFVSEVAEQLMYGDDNRIIMWNVVYGRGSNRILDVRPSGDAILPQAMAVEYDLALQTGWHWAAWQSGGVFVDAMKSNVGDADCWFKIHSTLAVVP